MRKKRKSFFSTLILAIVFWAGWFYLLIHFSPDSLWLFLVFHLLLFFSLFLTFSLILINSGLGFLLAAGIVGYLLLRWAKMAHFLNLILFISLLLTLELSLRKR